MDTALHDAAYHAVAITLPLPYAALVFCAAVAGGCRQPLII